jgi:hypothetical protein
MSTIHRLPCESFTESITWISETFNCDRRVATFLLWDVAVRIGTDRHYWIDEPRARRYIDALAPVAV